MDSSLVAGGSRSCLRVFKPVAGTHPAVGARAVLFDAAVDGDQPTRHLFRLPAIAGDVLLGLHQLRHLFVSHLRSLGD